MGTPERSNPERAVVSPATDPGGASRRRAGNKPPAFDPEVRLPSGEEVALSVLQRDRAIRARYLRDHHGSAEGVLCLCRTDGIPVGVGRRRAPEETFYLYPLHRGDRLRHAPGCPHFLGGQLEMSGQKGEGVVERIGGRIRVHVSSRLFTRPAGPRNSGGEAAAGEEPQGRSADAGGGLLTLLQVLWAEAELNRWRPGFAGKRPYGVVSWRLHEAACRVDVNRAELGPLFYVPCFFHEGHRERSFRAFYRFLGVLKPDKKGKRRFGFVAGCLRKAAVWNGEGRIAIHLAHSPRAVWTDPLKWARIVRTWRGGGFGERGEDLGSPKFVLMKVGREEGKTGPWLKLEELAALRLADTWSWIPITSDYERELALALVDRGRGFRKPLAPEVDRDELLPSFVLEDRGDRMHIEILTRMEGVESRTLAADKQSRYEELQQPVFWWDVRESEAVPDLPARAP